MDIASHGSDPQRLACSLLLLLFALHVPFAANIGRAYVTTSKLLHIRRNIHFDHSLRWTHSMTADFHELLGSA